MNTPSPIAASRPSERFGVLTLSLLIFALSAAAAVAVPAIQRARLAARAEAVSEALRAAAAAFQAYARERGDWPPADAGPGIPPTGMAEHLRDTPWSEPTPIGGRFVWKLGSLHQGQRYAAAVVITPTGEHPLEIDRAQFSAIDRQIDDGNFATGNFRLGYRHEPLFVLEH